MSSPDSPFQMELDNNLPQGVGCLRKWLLEFRESRNFIRKWSYVREISSNFVYFRITFYTTFRIIWHDFHTKFRIPSNKNLINNKYLWNLGLYWVLKLYKNKRNWNSNSDPKSIFSKGIRNKKNIQNIRNFENTKCRKHPIQHRRHFLRTAEKLQDADWGWGRYDNTPLNLYPFTAATR